MSAVGDAEGAKGLTVGVAANCVCAGEALTGALTAGCEGRTLALRCDTVRFVFAAAFAFAKTAAA